MRSMRFAFLMALVALSEPAMAQWSYKEGNPKPALFEKLGGGYVQPFTKAEWEASNFANSKDLQWFRDAKYGMFIHFGLSTRANKELSWGTCRIRKIPDDFAGGGSVAQNVWTSWPKQLKFQNFDAKEWVAIAQGAGFKYVVVIAKHHEGFHLWDTAFSKFKVTNTPFGRDYIKELSDACHAAKMPFGVYYSQRDWYHPDYQPVDPARAVRVKNSKTVWTPKPGETSVCGERHKKYIEYQFNVVRELCTKYGKLDIFWWDASYCGGMFTADMWDAEKLTRMVRELQPGILMNNRCSLPGDFDTPEQRLGFYQDWRPWESCMCLEKTWSYSGKPPKSRDLILGMIVQNACCDGNLLLSWGPKWDGEFDIAQKERLLEVGAWLKENGRAIYGTRGGPWKAASWGGSTRRGSTVWLHLTKQEGDTLTLPSLPGLTVLSAQLLNGRNLAFSQSQTLLTVTVPQTVRTTPDTIVELTLDKPADDLPAIASSNASVFGDAATYGSIVSRNATVKVSSNPWIEIDLGRKLSITGVRVLNPTGVGRNRISTLRLSVSVDGKVWQEVWKADQVAPQWEIPVTEFRAGIQVPGRTVRYLRLEGKPTAPTPLQLRQVEVWGKETTDDI